MKKKELTQEQLDKVISLRQIGASWLKIQHETGINRRTAKRTYEKWQHSKSLEELKEARKDVGAQAFREHIDSLVTLATSLVANLSVPSSLSDMEKNAEQFFTWLFEQDLLHHYISPREVADVYTMGHMQPFHIRDPLFYHREKELLFKSIKVHTREEIRWDNILDNRWKEARNKSARIVHELRGETSKVVNNYLKLERQADFLQKVKGGSRENNPVERMEEAVLAQTWKHICGDKLDEVRSWFQVSQSRRTGTSQDMYVHSKYETVFKFTGDTDKSLVGKVARICELATNNLCKGDSVQQLRNEVGEMKKASEELREMLNPVKLRPIILRTRCDLCPA